jgi:hypothetical protein
MNLSGFVDILDSLRALSFRAWRGIPIPGTMLVVEMLRLWLSFAERSSVLAQHDSCLKLVGPERHG